MSTAEEKVKQRYNRLIHLNAEANQPDELSDKDRARMRMLGEELARVYSERVRVYQQMYKSHPNDEWVQKAFPPENAHDSASKPADDSQLQEMMTRYVKDVTFDDMQAALERNPDDALKLWTGILTVAYQELDSGGFSCDALYHTDSRPWERAQFMVIRDSLVDAWKPKDAIEMSLIEMLVQAFISHHYWLRLANSMAAREYEAAEKVKDNKRWEGPTDRWNTPRLDVADAIDRAIAMADRFNRLYLRTLRQMRDLRRYSVPVTINNPEQVNIAADGGQQVNVQQKAKRKKKQTRTAQPHKLANQSKKM